MRERMPTRAVLGAVAAGALAIAGAATGTIGGGERATTLPRSSCGAVVGEGRPTYLITSDLPLQGADQAQIVQLTKAIELVLRNRNFKAGKYSIGYQSCDNSTSQRGAWDAGRCVANAQAYANDRSVLGVVGTYNSGCSKLEIPILNRAPDGPLAMISPVNTYVGLTKAGAGTVAGEPGVYYPTRKRNYARVVAADDYQAAAVAIYTKQTGARSVFVLTDNQTYGRGVASVYSRAARKLGIQVKGFQAWDARASSYAALGSKIKQSGAQAVFFGGAVASNGARLVADVRAAVGAKVTFFAPDGFTPFDAVSKGAGAAANGMIVSIAGYAVEQLGTTGKRFAADLQRFQGRKPDRYGIYAAQAAEVLLDAIARSDGSRASVTKELFETDVKDGILGTFRITPTGDTTGGVITMYRLPAGTIVANVTPALSFVKRL